MYEMVRAFLILRLTIKTDSYSITAETLVVQLASLNPENSLSIFLKYVLTVLESQRMLDGKL